jgi:predicted  nucleic acid-binding Zn-ribbon protein
VRDIPDEKKKEIISKWLAGDSKEVISANSEVSASVVTSVINEWKRELGSAIAEAYRGTGTETIVQGVNPSDIIQALKLLLSLNKFGVEMQSAGEFLNRFSKAVTSAGIAPEGLANILRQIMKLAELDGIEIYQIPAQVESLLNQKEELETQIKKLNAHKESLVDGSEIGPSLVEGRDDKHENVVDKDLLSYFVELKNQVEENGLSPGDVAAFVKMVKNAKEYGYDFAVIVDLVSNIQALERDRATINMQMRTLRESESVLAENRRKIEENLSSQKGLIDIVEKLTKGLGFDLHDFESISEGIEKLAKLKGLEYSSAKRKFFDDMAALQSESDATTKSEAIGASQQSRESVDMLNRLTSKGVTEQTLLKCVILREVFKVDLDTVAEDLRKYRDISNSVKQLTEIRAKLESEELVLRHKLMALEEQRERIMSSINDLINSSKSQVVSGPNAGLGELEGLMKAVRGDKISQDELRLALSSAIDSLCKTLDHQSFTRKILEHAKLALEHEQGLRVK